MEANVERNRFAAIAYLVGWVTGIFVLVFARDKFVKFHAMQSIVVFGALTVLMLLPVIGVLLGGLASLVWLLLLLVLAYKANKGEEWEVPVMGKFARKMLKRVDPSGV